MRGHAHAALCSLAALLASGCSGKGSPAVTDATGAGPPPDGLAQDAPPSDAASDALVPPDGPAPPDALVPCVPPAPGTAPTYTDLYTRYFAPGTPGHCAEDSCHGGDGYHNWPCGPDKDGCYAGMLERQLIDPLNPAASVLASPRFSPIAWVNTSGSMPRDGTRPFPPGSTAITARNDIIAWANACARNN